MIGVCRVHARTDVGAHIAAELAPLVGPDIECVLCAQERRDAEEVAAVTFRRQATVVAIAVVAALIEIIGLGPIYAHTRHDHASPYGIAFLTVVLQAIVAGFGAGLWHVGTNEPMNRADAADMWGWYAFRVLALALFALAAAMPLLGVNG